LDGEVTQAPVPTITPSIKLCLIGYSIFQKVIAETLTASGIDIVCLATQTSDPANLDSIQESYCEHGLYSPHEDVAKQVGARYLHLLDLNAPESIAAIKETGANIVLSCSAPVLKKAFIDAFEGRVLNYHGSRRYRGRAGASWLILHGETSDAVVLHWIDTGIDTGQWIAVSPFDWPANAYPIDLADSQVDSMRTLSQQLAGWLLDGGLPEQVADENRPYRPSLITSLDGNMDWRWSAEQVERAIRAFGWPYDGATAVLENSDRKTKISLKLARAEILEAEIPVRHPMAVGVVVARKPGAWTDIQCGIGVLRIHTIRCGLGEAPAASEIRLGGRFIVTEK